jgi:hypothetical protein
MACPPGVFCINYSSTIIFIILAIMICYYFYSNHNNKIYNKINKKIKNLSNVIKSEQIDQTEQIEKKNIYENIHERLNNTPSIDINDIYNEPTKSNNGIRVNIHTRGPVPKVQQIGILTKTNFTNNEGPGTDNESHILPLMGRKTYNRSNKWVYYTATDKYNQIKLPLSHNGKNCSGEYGCDEFMDGDTINIPELNGTFTVKIYENGSLQYIPY